MGGYVLNNDYSKKNILKHLSIPQNLSIPVIIFDFNLKEHTFEIRRGEQLHKDDNYFIFPKQSPSSPRVVFNTNNFTYHVIDRFPTPIGIQEYASKNKITLSNDFERVLNVMKTFYLKNDSGRYILNPMLISSEEQKIQLCKNLYSNLKIGEDKININKCETLFESKDNLSAIISAYKKLINSITQSPNTHYAFIYINGKNIVDTKYETEYFNLLYSCYVIKPFLDKSRKNKVCHYCGKKTTVTNDVATPFKFYNTDKPGFFENKNQKNAYKSFSLCETCYIKLLIGINSVNSNFKSSFMRVPFVVIPKSDVFFNNFDENRSYFMDIINRQYGRTQEIVKESLNYNFLSDFMFYDKNNSSFKIVKYISDVEFDKLRKINDLLDQLSYDLKKNFLPSQNKLTLFDFKDILFSNLRINSKKSHIITQTLLDLLEAIYDNIPLNNRNFFDRFLLNYKKGYFNNKEKNNTYFIIIKALYLYEFLIKLKIVEVKRMDINTFTKIKNEGLLKFFKDHEEIDGIRQGFIILGYLINRIVSRQKKDKKSSTFLDKIDYDGFDKTGLKEVMNEIEEYFKIYNLYTEPDLKTYAFEVVSKYINGNNTISPEEITFYILLGVNLGQYLAQIYSESKEGGNENGN